MKILVVDDRVENLESAKETLGKDHEVELVSDAGTAFRLLARQGAHYDVLLTDLFMPLGEFRGEMGRNALPPESIPVGLVFALSAANKGLRTVICTDANHHNDWLCTLLDLVGQKIPIMRGMVATGDAGGGETNQVVAYVEARYCLTSSNAKDWREAMEASGLFPELFPEQ